jgi:hypothetical protein
MISAKAKIQTKELNKTYFFPLNRDTLVGCTFYCKFPNQLDSANEIKRT